MFQINVYPFDRTVASSCRAGALYFRTVVSYFRASHSVIVVSPIERQRETTMTLTGHRGNCLYTAFIIVYKALYTIKLFNTVMFFVQKLWHAVVQKRLLHVYMEHKHNAMRFHSYAKILNVPCFNILNLISCNGVILTNEQ